jgi:hypothetical protein
MARAAAGFGRLVDAGAVPLESGAVVGDAGDAGG